MGFVTNIYNQYLIDCNKAEIAIGKRPNSALGAMLQAYLPTPSMYLQYRMCIFSGRKESNHQIGCLLKYLGFNHVWHNKGTMSVNKLIYAIMRILLDRCEAYFNSVISGTSTRVKTNNKLLTYILTHLAYIANGKKTCYIVQQFHWANKRDVTLRHL